MDWISRIKSGVEKERDLLLRSWEKAKFARDNAPTPTESHSDTTRSEQEKLVSALETEIKRVEQDLKRMSLANGSCEGLIAEWSYVEVDSAGTRLRLVVVSEGMGGKKMDEVQLISTLSPLGKELVGKASGDKFVFMGREMSVAVVG